MGVKIPQPGYLDPHPLVFKSSINTMCYQNCCNISCYHFDKINSIGLNKKKIVHMLGLESGVGVKIPRPGYLDPHPVSLVTDVTKFHMFCRIPKKPLKILLKMKQLQR